MRKVIVFLFIGVFISLPFIYWYINSSSHSSSVKGASTVSSGSKNGFSVKVSSSGGTWEISQFICKDKSECLSGLNSGKKVKVVSGGSSNDVFFEKESTWSGNDYGKIFIKPSWGSNALPYQISDVNNDLPAEIINTSGGTAVVFPLQAVSSSSVWLASFKN